MSDSDHAVVQTPQFGNFMSNTAGSTQALLHGEGTGNSLLTDAHNIADPLNMNHSQLNNNDFTPGNITRQNDKQNSADVAKKTLDDVTAAYHASLGNLDVTTSNEIQAALATGDPTKAAALLEQSKAGTGIYGIRQMNEKQKQLLSVMPGRAQLSPRYNLINNKAGA